jgi:hypothetical protein
MRRISMSEPTFFEQMAEVDDLLAEINRQDDEGHFADPETVETDEEEDPRSNLT